MSLPYQSLLTLQAYADGELEGAERDDAEKLLQESEQARHFVESLGVLGHGVRAADALDAHAFPDMVPSVMRAVDAEASIAEAIHGRGSKVHAPEPTRPPAQVTSLAAQREKRAQRSQIVVMIGALALAAAGILYVRGRHEADAEHAAAQAKHGPVVPQNEAEKGVEVHDIDSNSQSQVSVFYLPASGKNAASSVVVWIDDKGAP